MKDKLKLAKYIVEQIEEKDMINLVSESYEDVILRILVEFEEEHNSAEYLIEKKMEELDSQSD